MKIQVLSDLHLEFFGNSPWKDKFLSKLIPKEKVDLLVLAGDICTTATDLSRVAYESVMKFFRENWKNVVLVPGNHEYYYNTVEGTDEFLSTFPEYLNNRTVTIPGIGRVHGTTLWFPERPDNILHVHSGLNDFRVIDRNQSMEETLLVLEILGGESLRFLEGVEKGDIVVTHHLPSSASIPAGFKFSPLNRFYMNEKAEEILWSKEPSLWIHGHTHNSFNYVHGDTRVVCNPYGYWGHDENTEFDHRLVIEEV
jgi:predicted phosphodiesterase